MDAATLKSFQDRALAGDEAVSREFLQAYFPALNRVLRRLYRSNRPAWERLARQWKLTAPNANELAAEDVLRAAERILSRTGERIANGGDTLYFAAPTVTTRGANAGQEPAYRVAAPKVERKSKR